MAAPAPPRCRACGRRSPDAPFCLACEPIDPDQRFADAALALIRDHLLAFALGAATGMLTLAVPAIVLAWALA